MKSSKTCCGMTYIENTEIPSGSINDRIELEYYKIRKSKFKMFGKPSKKYGIEIQKREYKDDNFKVETNSVNYVTKSRDKVIQIIDTLKKHKVTPVGLNDVLDDLLKQE